MQDPSRNRQVSSSMSATTSPLIERACCSPSRLVPSSGGRRSRSSLSMLTAECGIRAKSRARLAGKPKDVARARWPHLPRGHAGLSPPSGESGAGFCCARSVNAGRRMAISRIPKPGCEKGRSAPIASGHPKSTVSRRRPMKFGRWRGDEPPTIRVLRTLQSGNLL